MAQNNSSSNGSPKKPLQKRAPTGFSKPKGDVQMLKKKSTSITNAQNANINNLPLSSNQTISDIKASNNKNNN